MFDNTERDKKAQASLRSISQIMAMWIDASFDAGNR
jgi:hypothetical protein